MAASQTTRLAIYTWTAGTDTFTRDQMTTSHTNIESRVAGYNQAGSRPAASAAYTGFVHYSSTDSSAGTLSYCNGTAWFNIGALGSTTPNAIDGNASAGSSQDAARSDHKHAIANDTINNAMIDANAVQSDQIQQDAVTSVKILAGAVTLPKIVDATAGYRILAKADSGTGDWAELPAGTNSVLRRDGSGDLEFGTIDTNHIGADEVKNANLDSTDGSEAVSTNTIQDGAVTTLKLDQTSGSEAVTTATIKDSNVTLAKIETVAANSILANFTGSTATLTEQAAGASEALVRGSSGNLKFDKITNDMLASTTITNASINGSAGINASKLAAGEITDTQLSNSSCSFYAAASAAPDGNKVYIQSNEPSPGAAGNLWLQT